MKKAVQRTKGRTIIMLSATDAAADILLNVPTKHRYSESFKQKNSLKQ